MNPNYVNLHIGCSADNTQMSDELLGDLHPLEKLLQEAVRKPLLYGRDVRLHVLQTPGETMEMENI